jgi:hypothetical protein
MAILKKIYKTENLNDSAHEALFLYGIIEILLERDWGTASSMTLIIILKSNRNYFTNKKNDHWGL